MKIDIEIEFVGDRENASNLIAGLGVGIGTAADQIGTIPAGLDQELVGTEIVEQAFLREVVPCRIAFSSVRCARA